MTNKTSELFYAVYAGEIDKVEVCILSGADTNAINHSGDTPLIEAIASDNAKSLIRYCQPKVVRTRHANPRLPNSNAPTA